MTALHLAYFFIFLLRIHIFFQTRYIIILLRSLEMICLWTHALHKGACVRSFRLAHLRPEYDYPRDLRESGFKVIAPRCQRSFPWNCSHIDASLLRLQDPPLEVLEAKASCQTCHRIGIWFRFSAFTLAQAKPKAKSSPKMKPSSPKKSCLVERLGKCDDYWFDFWVKVSQTFFLWKRNDAECLGPL